MTPGHHLVRPSTVPRCRKCGLRHNGNGDPRPKRAAGATGCSAVGCGNRRAPGNRYCRAHKNAYFRGHRRAYRDLSPGERIKAIARAKVNAYIRRGKIQRGPCEGGCGRKAQAHHEDYSKPVAVRWLCRRCHRKEHARLLLNGHSLNKTLTGPRDRGYAHAA